MQIADLYILYYILLSLAIDNKLNHLPTKAFCIIRQQWNLLIKILKPQHPRISDMHIHNYLMHRSVAVSAFLLVAAPKYGTSAGDPRQPLDSAYLDEHWARDRAELGLLDNDAKGQIGGLDFVADIDNRILHCPPESTGIVSFTSLRFQV